LAGEANGINSTFPAAPQATSSANSLAVQLGGGMNIALKRHIAVRAFEADWLRTQLPNATTTAQNTLKLGAGLVLRFK
jgi:outer membrane immunogenic protein